jgi:MGT family glycosyltransferase
MAKIAFLNIPAHGHTNPTLAVVKTLLARGHEVIYYSGEEMRDLIERTGADFRPYPEPMPTSKEIADALHELIDATMILIRISEAHTAWVIDEMRREQPDVIIYDSTAMWGYIAGRILGIPHICSFTHFVLDGSQSHLPRGTFLRLIRQAIPKLPRIIKWKRTMKQQFGSKNVGGITENGDINMVFTSRAFHPENRSLGATFRFVGPSLDASARSVDFPFEALGDGRVVYISLGTINHQDTAFYQAAFAAFADYPAQFVLSVGKHTDIASLGAIPANFIVRNYVPQLEILQRVDAFITHGGMNSVHEGLVYGVPEIVVPHQMEQLLNGIRVAEVGAGLMLGEKPPYGRVTPAQLRAALDRILNEPSFRQQAAYYGETLVAAGGAQQAVAEIEQLIGIEQPTMQPA